MNTLMENKAEISEFVQASIPIFNNCIAITDYDLRLLVNCVVHEESGHKKIVISNHYDRIPESISIIIQNAHLQNQFRKEPFTIYGQENDPDGENYCINLFFGDDYAGTCTLLSQIRPIRQSDLLLFQLFADYIRRVLSDRVRMAPKQFISIKAIFSELLQSFPVSKGDFNWALELMRRNMKIHGLQFGYWYCLVIRSANSKKNLPEGYLCTTLENMLPHATAVPYEESIVCLCMLPAGQNYDEIICSVLQPYLENMNFRTGISAPFQDILKARDYYLQALAVLQTGLRRQPDLFIYHFKDQILSYMLQNCVGEFEADMLLTQGLAEICSNDSGVDYWETLRCYLDNECNASHTAKELFVHRSTLLQRLEKLKTIVDFDTPEQRLYLRNCFYLFDLLENCQRTSLRKTD